MIKKKVVFLGLVKMNFLKIENVYSECNVLKWQGRNKSQSKGKNKSPPVFC